tara:strand:+ start:4742 stop:6055 length:1314 start_codon:yes stop_codon:yes gene_type:complete
LNKRTIIASASAPGRGGVSVVRMSGEKSKNIAERMCGELSEPWKFKKCSIMSSGNEVIDSGMVVFFQSPHSYTGEDVVEFHCHGNPMIVSLIVDEAVSLGAVVADPGEFTKTAFLNDKIDLAQAESVADLINAQSKSAVLAANSSLSGEFSNKINTLVDEVVRGRVVIEANIDFPEEDIESDLLNSIKKDLEICLEEVSKLLMGVREGVRLREGYSVAIVGAPNAGKSTLLNVLARDDVAITSNVPGTTRDLVKTVVNIAGVTIEFIDTAGVRSNPDSDIEKEGINRSLNVVQKSNFTLLVKDISDVKDFDIDLGDYITVMNKSDLIDSVPKNEKDIFYLSCATGEGVEDLLRALLARLGVDEGAETAFLSRKRHEVSLEKAKELLKESVVSLVEGQALELVAENLRSAHHHLGDILRPMSSDDLLGEIFSEFCIGK